MTTRKRMHSSPKNHYCDAHFHSSGSGSLEVPGILNGTSPKDWAEVLRLAGNHPGTRAAIGLHPCQLDHAPHDWQDQFQAALTSGARAVGEIGLDKRFAKAPFDAQCDAFAWQLKQAAARNLPVSIHCFKATDPLLRLLRQNPIPTRGVHLHAYSGSAEEVAPFVELGAYFSFHAA
ncbi:MAG: hypothetical protein GVY36_01350, partial [Verrucomicrobia bacterium]|nr:hypothetical protein [Verrucomicrobiota bacterium]